jgi:transcriptional regulator with XRE-family HTH domain
MGDHAPIGNSLPAEPGYDPRLKVHRLRAGLTQAEVAEALAVVAWEEHREHVGVDANMVSKWERGIKRPRKLYRRLLCSLYGATEEELGLRSLAALASFDGTHGDDVNRRDFLRSAALMGAAAVPLGAWETICQSIEKPSVDEGTVAAYASIAGIQRAMYWSTPARALFDASAAHTNLGLHLLRSTGGRGRGQLAGSVAESALLSGRLAFFDLAEPSAAQSFLTAARALTQEAEDHALAAAVFGHIAFGPGFAGDGDTAAAVLDAAFGHAAQAEGPRLHSWLHCVGAEISARTGDSRTALLHVRQAEDALTGPGVDPTWLDFYDFSRLGGCTGYVQLLAGDNRGAATTLEGAIAALSPPGRHSLSQRARGPAAVPLAPGVVAGGLVVLFHQLR